MTSEIFGALGALIFVIALMMLMLWAVRRMGLVPGHVSKKSGTGSRLEILESRMVDSRNRLVLVKWDGREYLLAAGQTGMYKIDGPGSPGAEAENFAAMLGDTDHAK